MSKLIGLLFIALQFTLQTYSQSASELIQKMIDEEAKIKSLKVTMVMNERVDGKMSERKGDFKISYYPFKIYMKQEYPKKGMEVLFVENKNNNRAYVNTNGIPWVTLSIDPNSKTMRNGYHHSLYNSGYRYFADLVKHLLNKHYNNIEEVTTYTGEKNINGYQCHQIVYSSPSFGYFDYYVKKEISLPELAKKFYVNDYMLVDKNPGKVDFDEVKTDKTIKIPNDYGKKVIINLDVKTYLPRSVHVYDEKGLFQEYYYSNIVVNPYFSLKDFDVNNSNYDF